MWSDKIKFLLLCLILGLILQPNLALSNNEDLNTPFYEDDVFAIYPSSSYWCSPDFKYGDNVELDVVYNVSHEQRDKKLFRGSSYSDYSRFFNRKIVPIIAKRCPGFRGWKAYAKLHFNTKEDWSNNNRRDWDRMRFQYSRKAIRSRNGTTNSFAGMYKEQIITYRALAVLADKSAERREYAKQQGHPFRALAGGTYHDTIYTGDFVAQNEFAWYYLSQIKINNKDDIAMGMLLSLFGSTFSSTKKEMTVLEEISMYYLKRSTERPDNCFDSGALERTFTYNYPELVYGDGYRVPASKIKSKYRINSNFKGLCDRLCEKQGVLYSVAHGMNAEMEKLEFADLFRGVDEMIKHFSCRSPEIKRFEKNLLEMNRREINQPSSVRRNTFQTMIDSPASRYMPYEPHSVIADQFMASNAKKPGVITTASGMQYIMLNRGHGQHPKQDEIVSIFYKGTLANGDVIDKRYVSGTPRTSSIDDNRKGMHEGILLLKPGGRIKIFVPPELGYGASANGTINKDSVLIYEIELVTSANSPSHISQLPTITPQAKATKEEKDGQQSVPVTANKNNLPKLNKLPKLDKPTIQNRPKPQLNKPVEKKPVEKKPEKIIIQVKPPELLASENKLFINKFQFPKKVTLDNTTLDFLVVKLLTEQLDKNTWVSMLASRWNYEKSQKSPTGGRFFSPSAKQFSASDIDRVMAPFKAWMLQQSRKLPQNLTIPASVSVAKIGPAIHAIPADGCAILGEQKYILKHSMKLSTAITVSTMPGMQKCQQQMKSNLGDIMGCMQNHPGDPNFCRQQMKDKLKLCLEDSSKNGPDNWDKVSVKWIESDFNTSKCSGNAAYDRLRSLNQMPLGTGSVQVPPSRINARFIFNKELKLPQVKSGIFDLKSPLEKGVLWLNIKPVSAKIAPEISNKGLGIQINVEIIGAEYRRLL